MVKKSLGVVLVTLGCSLLSISSRADQQLMVGSFKGKYIDSGALRGDIKLTLQADLTTQSMYDQMHRLIAMSGQGKIVLKGTMDLNTFTLQGTANAVYTVMYGQPALTKLEMRLTDPETGKTIQADGFLDLTYSVSKSNMPKLSSAKMEIEEHDLNSQKEIDAVLSGDIHFVDQTTDPNKPGKYLR